MDIQKQIKLIILNEKNEVFLSKSNYIEHEKSYFEWRTPGYNVSDIKSLKTEAITKFILKANEQSLNIKLPLVYTQERLITTSKKDSYILSESYYLLKCNELKDDERKFDFFKWAEIIYNNTIESKFWSLNDLSNTLENFFTERITDWYKAILNYKNGGYMYSQGVSFAELQMELEDFNLKDITYISENSNITYRYATQHDFPELLYVVELVDKDWVQFFSKDDLIFIAEEKGKIVGFTLLDIPDNCLLSRTSNKFGSIGCVGVIPAAREKGIGLAMVAHATDEVKKAGCTNSSIHYTHLEKWYKKLGYITYLKYCFKK